MVAEAAPANVVHLRTDDQAKREILAELRPLLEQVCAVVNRERRLGYAVNMSFGIDAFGQQVPQNVGVLKIL